MCKCNNNCSCRVSLEVGKTYETAHGAQVKILAKTEANSFSFFGELLTISKGSPIVFSSDGTVKLGNCSGIVKEYVEPKYKYVNMYYESARVHASKADADRNSYAPRLFCLRVNLDTGEAVKV